MRGMCEQFVQLQAINRNKGVALNGVSYDPGSVFIVVGGFALVCSRSMLNSHDRT